MLSRQAAPIVRDTLPAVGASLGAITELFYTRMFEERPELLRTLFNRANQANGAQREALAGAVAAFATTLVEHPGERPDAILGRIANKHASLGITSDQYTLVGRHLLGAVKEVLGDAVTPAVAAAWDEVYWLMANALIAMEARLYAGAGVDDGVVWRDMEIADRTEESADTASFELRRPDGLPTEPFLPGQYVSVRVELPDGAQQIRQYSLSTSPGRKTWRITVKRERSADGRVPEGEVSSWLHAHARAGQLLQVSLPFGDLVLPDGEGPLLLASAGIGITPMLSMLDHLAGVSPNRPVVVIHADRSPPRPRPPSGTGRTRRPVVPCLAAPLVRERGRGVVRDRRRRTRRAAGPRGARTGRLGRRHRSDAASGDHRVPVRAAAVHAGGPR